jgi:hypothetical protein
MSNETNEVRINLMVVESMEINPSSGLRHWAEPCETLSEEDALKQWEVDTKRGDKIIAMCEVVLKNEVVAGTLEYPYAKTYEALMALNELSSEPRVQDLLTRIFTLGFKAGLETKARQLRQLLEVSEKGG